jgi:hypothetical protein
MHAGRRLQYGSVLFDDCKGDQVIAGYSGRAADRKSHRRYFTGKLDWCDLLWAVKYLLSSA